MSRIAIPAGDTPESHRLGKVQPAMGRAMAGLADAIYQQSGLPIRVREALRMRVAQLNQCSVCLGYRFPDLAAAGVDEAFYGEIEHWKGSGMLSEQEKLAIEYAERFVEDHLAIDDHFFVRLHAAFSDVAIYEMTTSIAGLLANGRILQVLQVEQACAMP